MRPLTGPLQTGGSVYAFTVSANADNTCFFGEAGSALSRRDVRGRDRLASVGDGAASGRAHGGRD